MISYACAPEIKYITPLSTRKYVKIIIKIINIINIKVIHNFL